MEPGLTVSANEEIVTLALKEETVSMKREDFQKMLSWLIEVNDGKKGYLGSWKLGDRK